MTARTLVAATDGSEESLRAVEWAAREAVLHGAPLRIVSVAAVPRMIGLQVRPDRDFVADLLREERDQALSAALQGPGSVRHAVLNSALGPIAVIPSS